MQAKELRAHHGGKVRALRFESFDAAPSAGQPAQIQIRVGEVQERLPRGRASTGALPHVHGRLEVLDGSGDVAAHLEKPCQVQLQRAEDPRIPGSLASSDALLVRSLRFTRAIVTLQSEPEASERERLGARRCHVFGALDGPMQKLVSLFLAPEKE